jgi:hypothetical protein
MSIFVLATVMSLVLPEVSSRRSAPRPWGRRRRGHWRQPYRSGSAPSPPPRCQDGPRWNRPAAGPPSSAAPWSATVPPTRRGSSPRRRPANEPCWRPPASNGRRVRCDGVSTPGHGLPGRPRCPAAHAPRVNCRAIKARCDRASSTRCPLSISWATTARFNTDHGICCKSLETT